MDNGSIEDRLPHGYVMDDLLLTDQRKEMYGHGNREANLLITPYLDSDHQE